MKRPAIVASTALLLAACNSGGTSSTGSKATSSAAAAELTDEQVEKAEIPVEEDFEDEAFKAIDADNVDDKVAAIESEMNADK